MTMTNTYNNYIAQRAEVLKFLKAGGQHTAQDISKATGFGVWPVRQHCEDLRRVREVFHNRATDEYSA